MKRPAVFIDRDGTINEQMGYINHVSRFRLIPGTSEAIRLLNTHGCFAIVVTNQSGVGRGYFPVQLVYDVHEQMKSLLAKEGAAVDGTYFCPHHPNGSVREFAIECDCRKPKTGLIKRACEDFEIDMDFSYVVGDRCSDIEMAERAGLKGVLVKTGYGRGDIEYVLPGNKIEPVHIAKDLLQAVKWVLKTIGK